MLFRSQEDAKFLKENYKSENFEIINTNEEGINFYKVISKKEQVQVGDSIAELDIDIFLATYYPDSMALKFWKLDYTLSKSNNDLISTHIDVVSNNTFDVKGDYFKVKLSDKNNNSIKNAQIVFSINGAKKQAQTHLLTVISIPYPKLSRAV